MKYIFSGILAGVVFLIGGVIVGMGIEKLAKKAGFTGGKKKEETIEKYRERILLFMCKVASGEPVLRGRFVPVVDPDTGKATDDGLMLVSEWHVPEFEVQVNVATAILPYIASKKQPDEDTQDKAGIAVEIAKMLEEQDRDING